MCSDINNKRSNYRTFLRKTLLVFLFWGKAEDNKCRGNEINLIYCICLLSLEKIHLWWCSPRHRNKPRAPLNPFRCGNPQVNGFAKLQTIHVTHSATENTHTATESACWMNTALCTGIIIVRSNASFLTCKLSYWWSNLQVPYWISTEEQDVNILACHMCLEALIQLYTAQI